MLKLFCLSLCFDFAWLIFKLTRPLFCLSLPLVMIRVFWIYGSTVLDLCFDCAWPLSRLLDWSCVCFDYARLLPLMFQLCSICFSTVLVINFDCARPMSWICSTYIRLCLTYVCLSYFLAEFDQNFFYNTWFMFRLSWLISEVFRLYSTMNDHRFHFFWSVSNFSTNFKRILAVPSISFHCNWPMYWLLSTYISCFSWASFDWTRCMLRPCSTFVSPVFDLCFAFLDRSRVDFDFFST